MSSFLILGLGFDLRFEVWTKIIEMSIKLELQIKLG